MCSVCLEYLISDTVCDASDGNAVMLQVKLEPDFDEEPEPGQKSPQECSGQYKKNFSEKNVGLPPESVLFFNV